MGGGPCESGSQEDITGAGELYTVGTLAKMALVRGPVMVSARNTFMRVMGGNAYKRHSADMAYDVSTAA